MVLNGGEIQLRSTSEKKPYGVCYLCWKFHALVTKRTIFILMWLANVFNECNRCTEQDFKTFSNQGHIFVIRKLLLSLASEWREFPWGGFIIPKMTSFEIWNWKCFVHLYRCTRKMTMLCNCITSSLECVTYKHTGRHINTFPGQRQHIRQERVQQF